MFASFLEKHPMRDLLAEQVELWWPGAAQRDAWAGISPAHRRELEELAEEYRDQPYPMRLASGFLDFSRTGSRKSDETPYFFRRRKLCAAVLACCAGEDALDAVTDGIWCICEESSWVISAHNVNPIPGAPTTAEYPLPDPDRPYIDLFAAQTGMILSLTLHLLKPQLDEVSPMLAQRVQRELRLRILSPFMETDAFWWMGVKRQDLCNWTPWILSNVMYTAGACRLPRAQLAALLDRACRMLDRWLAVVPKDGGCDEGAGYWNMAGGALADCLELLERVTEGRMCLWQEPHAAAILRFPMAVALGDGWYANFADCDARPWLSGERLQLAGEKLSDAALTAFGSGLRGSLADQLNDVPHFGRLLSLLFHPPVQAAPASLPQQVWLPDLQLRVVRRDGMILCCKGGHNGESHNHNDVGSFMLYVDGMPLLVDAGNMTYTAVTFSDRRYTLWNTRSAYHNVPLVCGMEQAPGREHCAREVRMLPDGLSLELGAAYPEEAGIERLHRQLSLEGEGAAAALRLTDDIRLARAGEVCWTFLFRQRPELRGGTLCAGPAQLCSAPELRVEIEEIPVEDPRMARSYPGSLWRVRMRAEAAGAHRVTFLMRRSDGHAQPV